MLHDHESPQAGLSLFPEDEPLLPLLAREIIAKHKHNLEKLLIILPTQRLATILLAMLAKEIGSFVPPKILTLEQFIQSHIKPELKATSPMTQELLLSQLLLQNSYSHLRVGHEHELNQFFNDLTEMNLLDQAHEKMQAILADDFHKSNEHLQSLSTRVSEIFQLKDQYLEVLASKGRQSRCSLEAQTAADLLDSPSLIAGHAWVYVACFTTIKEYFKPLLKELAERDHVSIWLSAKPHLLSELNPLGELADAIGLSQIAPKTGPKPKRQIQIWHAESILAEVLLSLELAKKAMAAGIPASQIVILLTSEQTYGRLLKTLVAKTSLQANLAVSTSLKHASLGAFLEMLAERLCGNSSLELLTAIFTHPFGVSLCRSLAPQDSTIETTWIASALAQENTEHPALQSMINLFEEAKATFHYLEKPLRDWLNDYTALIEKFLVPMRQKELDASLTSALEAFDKLAETFTELAALSNASMTFKHFVDLFHGQFSAMETRNIGYPLKGIQVLTLIESRYVPFEVAIVLGCIEGCFPKAMPKDHLIDNWFKQELGLPAWQYVEALEDTTFHLLKQNCKNLFLCYPKEAGKTAAVRSRFIERLLAERADLKDCSGMPLIDATALERQERKLAQDGFPHWRKQAGGYTSPRKPILSEFSASSLQMLLHCPYQFLLYSLKVKTNQRSNFEKEIAEGIALHAVLEGFFTGKVKGKKILAPIPNQIDKKKFRPYAQKRLVFLSQKIVPNWHDSSLGRHLELFSYPRFIDHLETIWPETPDKTAWQLPKKISKELAFGLKEQSQIEIELKRATPTKVAFKGVIDRVDEWDTGYLLTDYKRKNIPKGKDLAQGLYPQLIVYALSLENFPEGARSMDEGIVGYYSILDGTWQTQGAGQKARQWSVGTQIVQKNTRPLRELWNNLEKAWTRRLDLLEDESQNFIPEVGEACTFCAYSGICRKEDPVFREPYTQRDQHGAS